MSAELLGIPRVFEFQGRRFQVCQRDLSVEAQFVEWIKSEAALDLWRLKATVPPDFYAEQHKIYADKLHSKQFKWGTETVHKAYWSEDGQRQILYLKMKRGEEKGGDLLDRATVDEIAKDAAKWEELRMMAWEQDEPDFFAELQKELAKTKTPLLGNPSSAPPVSTSTT